MSAHSCPTYAHTARFDTFSPKSHGKPGVDDLFLLIGNIFISRRGLRRRDAPKEYGPHKTLYDRWKRWNDKVIFH
jgi:transposase